MFCEKCGKDTLTSLRWLGSYRISYSCSCGHSAEFDFQKKPLLKLKWRVDWPMRWAYEKVDFEPGGKDHSTAGGSYDTGKEIIKAVWHSEAPTYVMYDFINVKGKAGKMSSSSGEVIELADVLEIYEPEVIRYIFAGTRPNREFSISFDVDVLNVYEDFDKAERIYFSEEAVPEKDTIKYRSAYELSYIGTIPPKIPYQPGFRHLTTLLQIYNFDLDKVIGYFEKQLKYEHDRRRLRARAECAANWLKRYAPEEFRFHIQDSCLSTLSAPEKEILHIFADKLLERKWTDKELHEEIYVLCQSKNFQVKDFFRAAYLALINKERGPRLASFVLEIGKEKVAGLLKKA
jgi:lysyl-tRNA synthetase class 1